MQNVSVRSCGSCGGWCALAVRSGTGTGGRLERPRWRAPPTHSSTATPQMAAGGAVSRNRQVGAAASICVTLIHSL